MAERKESTRKSVYFPLDMLDSSEGRRGYRDLYNTRYVRMLIDDVAHSIVPYGGESRRKDFCVKVMSKDTEAEKLVIDALKQSHSSRSLAASTCYFIQECAMFIMLEGEALYEIVYYDKEEGSPNRYFKLKFIPPWSIGRRWGKRVQIIPEEIAARMGSPTTVELASPDIACFSCGTIEPAKNRRILETLASAGEEVLPEFYVNDIAQQGTSSSFELKEYERVLKTTIAAATREYGWTAGRLMHDRMSEYYFLVRCLRFEMLKATMREDILRTLNMAFSRAGSIVDIDVTLVMEGLPNKEDIKKSMLRLQEGKTEFKEILAPYISGM